MAGEGATYQQIQAWIRARHGFTVKTCWIAHAKELSGVPVRRASNRREAGRREHPCPPEKLPAIREAFEHFELLP